MFVGEVVQLHHAEIWIENRNEMDCLLRTLRPQS